MRVGSLGIGVLCVGLGIATAACNLTKFTADQTAPVLKAAAPGFNQESDVELARLAAPGQLKTVEGFHLATPTNETYIKILAQGYCEYAFGFLEGDMEEAHFQRKFDEEHKLAARATNLYLRCMNYGLMLLDSDFEKALYGENAAFEKVVAEADNVDGLFWTAFGLASAINLNRDDMDMAAYLAKAKMMFERVIQLDDTFYNGGAHLALGMLNTVLPAALGGKPDVGKKEFDRCIAISDGKFLIPQVLAAYNYGVNNLDQKYFHETLVKVLQTSPAVFPDQRLANELAHIKARRYLAHEKELF
jgi:hypothetical protein